MTRRKTSTEDAENYGKVPTPSPAEQIEIGCGTTRLSEATRWTGNKPEGFSTAVIVQGVAMEMGGIETSTEKN